MKIPMDWQMFSEFIENNHLFDKTKDNLIICLKNFYMQEPEKFEEMLNADVDKIISTYKFVNEGVSLSKSFSYDPPLDYISVNITVLSDKRIEIKWNFRDELVPELCEAEMTFLLQFTPMPVFAIFLTDLV